MNDTTMFGPPEAPGPFALGATVTMPRGEVAVGRHDIRARALRFCALAALAMGVLLVSPTPRAHAFWVVNFGPAATLPKGGIGFAAGIGGQVILAGDPTKTNAFFMIPHAGVRFGLAERIDLGVRLAPVPLPYSSVGPGFGGNLDVKFLLTKPSDKVGFALIAGAGGAHVLVQENHRTMWSPNAAFLLTVPVRDKLPLTFMGRYVYGAIPTANGGSSGNFFHIAGLSVGLKVDVAPRIALLPEVGAYWYEGQIASTRVSGPGFQYGLMLATAF